MLTTINQYASPVVPMDYIHVQFADLGWLIPGFIIVFSACLNLVLPLVSGTLSDP